MSPEPPRPETTELTLLPEVGCTAAPAGCSSLGPDSRTGGGCSGRIEDVLLPETVLGMAFFPGRCGKVLDIGTGVIIPDCLCVVLTITAITTITSSVLLHPWAGGIGGLGLFPREWSGRGGSSRRCDSVCRDEVILHYPLHSATALPRSDWSPSSPLQGPAAVVPKLPGILRHFQSSFLGRSSSSSSLVTVVVVIFILLLGIFHPTRDVGIIPRTFIESRKPEDRLGFSHGEPCEAESGRGRGRGGMLMRMMMGMVIHRHTLREGWEHRQSGCGGGRDSSRMSGVHSCSCCDIHLHFFFFLLLFCFFFIFFVVVLIILIGIIIVVLVSTFPFSPHDRTLHRSSDRRRIFREHDVFLLPVRRMTDVIPFQVPTVHEEEFRDFPGCTGWETEFRAPVLPTTGLRVQLHRFPEMFRIPEHDDVMLGFPALVRSDMDQTDREVASLHTELRHPTSSVFKVPRVVWGGQRDLLLGLGLDQDEISPSVLHLSIPVTEGDEGDTIRRPGDVLRDHCPS